jgi:chaperonin cofactor prefoldin
VTSYGILKIIASLASLVVTLEVTDRADEEALHRKIKRLKAQEKRIREERHRLEAVLRSLIFKRYLDLSEKYELKKA